MIYALTVSMAAVMLQSQAYEFVHRTERLVEFRRGMTLLVGRLDSNGEFTLDHTIGIPEHGIMYRSGPLRPETIGVRSNEPQPVYELRSGVLVPGTMADGGPFVPEVGGKIIRFGEYRYSLIAPSIWNLPGYFRPAGGPPLPAPRVWVPTDPLRLR